MNIFKYLTPKKNENVKVCVNYILLKNVTEKYQYFHPFEMKGRVV